MKKYVLVVAVAAALFSCSGNPKADATQTDKNKQETAQVPDMHNAETSLDYWGVYEGTLPAASSPGIKTTLTLNKDKTFTLIPTCSPARNDSRGGCTCAILLLSEMPVHSSPPLSFQPEPVSRQ